MLALAVHLLDAVVLDQERPPSAASPAATARFVRLVQAVSGLFGARREGNGSVGLTHGVHETKEDVH